MEDHEPTIDERLQALTHSLELMQLDTEQWRADTKRLDARERKARAAILAGIAGYLRELNREDANGAEPES
jgi:hypothetical protein